VVRTGGGVIVGRKEAAWAMNDAGNGTGLPKPLGVRKQTAIKAKSPCQSHQVIDNKGKSTSLLESHPAKATMLLKTSKIS
jgi:hypothetical protein